MEMYLWSGSCDLGVRDVNGSDDAYIVYHEYTHGLSFRLITDAAGVGALNRGGVPIRRHGRRAGAIGMRRTIWWRRASNRHRRARRGARAACTRTPPTLRSQAFDCPVGAAAPACPGSPGAGAGGYTYGDFGRILGFPEVHADGEIWVETLWDLRAALIAAHGAADGVTRARALVTDGMRLSPAYPTFLNMRDAILQADVNRGFGDRDLGSGPCSRRAGWA